MARCFAHLVGVSLKIAEPRAASSKAACEWRPFERSERSDTHSFLLDFAQLLGAKRRSVEKVVSNPMANQNSTTLPCPLVAPNPLPC